MNKLFRYSIFIGSFLYCHHGWGYYIDNDQGQTYFISSNGTITGPGTIVGVDNANPMSLESYQLPERKAWQGRCLVIVKSTKKEGKITLSASAEGIPSSQLTITT